MASKELKLWDYRAGQFYTDNAENYHKHGDLFLAHQGPYGSDSDQDGVFEIEQTQMPFLPQWWNMNDLKDTDEAYHITEGRRDVMKMDYPSKNIAAVNGTFNIFRGNNHPPYYKSYTVSRADETRCLTFGGNYQKTEAAGVLFGARYINVARRSIARWTSPIGLQFKWRNLRNNGDTEGDRLRDVFLMYTDNWAPGGLLYMPLLRNGSKFQNRASYYKGFNWHETQATYSNKGGEYCMFASDNAIDLIKDRYTRSACIGMAFMIGKDSYEPLTRQRYYELWDFKLLYDKPTLDKPSSKLVMPEPHLLSDRMDNARLKLF